MIDLAAMALALPDVARGIACAGTALESTTYTTRKKAFLFVSKKEVRLKLGPSAQEAERRGFPVGANGWVKVPNDAMPPASVMKRWIAESHAAFAGGGEVAKKKSSAKKPRQKR